MDTPESIRAASILWSLLAVAVPSRASASSLDVHVLQVVDSTSSKADPELTTKLRHSLDSHAPKTWNIIPGGSPGQPACDQVTDCLTVSVTHAGDTFVLRLLSWDGKLVASKSMALPHGTDPIDIADALVVKIIFLIKNAKIGSPSAQGQKPAVPAAPHGTEPEGGTAEPVVPQPQPQVEPGQTGTPVAPAVEVQPVEATPPVPGPEVASPVPVPAPEPEHVYAKPPVKIKLRLPISGSYMTGFDDRFNSGGIEIGLILIFFHSIGLRIDVGIHFGGFEDDDGGMRYRSLPIDFMGGYRTAFKRLRLGVSVGLYMMGLWFDFLTQERGKASEFVIGVAVLFDIDFQIAPAVSLGLFLRPVYITDDVNIEYGGTTIFELPKFQLSAGISLVVNI